MTVCVSCSNAAPRRRQVRERGLNGIEWTEISDDRRTVTIGFLGKAPRVSAGNVRIDAGPSAAPLKVVDVRLCVEDDPDLDDCLTVTLDGPGDLSRYRLFLVEAGPAGRPGTKPLGGFDPHLACAEVSFAAGCATGLDCAADDSCLPPRFDEPELSYLAKDYASFRQLILDRLALVMPDWTERHVPDLGITLVELLAYAGDHLSYYQDAVATEAYLDTARLRTSVRRHLRLIDHRLHEGCNARAWVAIETRDRVTLRAGDYWFATAPGNRPDLVGPALWAEALRGPGTDSVSVFEPLNRRDVELYPCHSSIRFWTGGEQQCCLPAGATRATLRDEWEDFPAEREKQGPARTGSEQHPEQRPTDGPDQTPPYEGKPPIEARRRCLHLVPGDVLILEETLGPITGDAADADPGHRHAVRLTSVTPVLDEAFDQPVVEVEWASEDALPFSLCLSSVEASCCELIEPSRARGNVILVDHGRTVAPCGADGERIEIQTTDPQPGPCMPSSCSGGYEHADPGPGRVWSDHRLEHSPITHAEPFPRSADVARSQARLLEAIPAAAEARLDEIWQDVQRDHRLDDGELRELRQMFGQRALRDAGLDPQAADHRSAVVWLLARHDRLLAPKLRRLRLLARRARTGTELSAADVAEVGESWGAAYAAGLHPDDRASWGPASAALGQDPRRALPAVRLLRCDAPAGTRAMWKVRPDLLNSGPDDPDFVVDVDDEGRGRLRFGDGRQGRALGPGTCLAARYRITGGTTGNVGAEAIARLVTCSSRLTGIEHVRNPLAARGGTDAEPIADAKLFGPSSIGELQRAVIADDYATIAGRTSGVQRAKADLRWTGSWYEARVAVDPMATRAPDAGLLHAIEDTLEPLRRIGHDVAVCEARSVPIDLGLRVCVLPIYRRADVQRALLELLGSGTAGGLFHPDQLTFGTNLEVSRLVAAAQKVPGVESVTVTRLERLFEGPDGELEDGILRLAEHEIPRLDNDPSAPERGRLVLEMRGGA